MYALIQREIRDHVIFFMGAIALAGTMVALSIPMLDNRGWAEMAVLTVLPVVVLAFFAMGAVQMHTDKTRRVSAFISTLSVSRNRILLAKVLAGVLAILIALVPIAVTVTILMQIYAAPIPIYSVIILEVFAGSFLATFACYCIGLQAGWHSGRLAQALGGLALTGIIASMILIKGFAPEMMVILSLFIVASLARTWHLFTSTPL